jgi:sorting and assembly machinery component 37
MKLRQSPLPLNSNHNFFSTMSGQKLTLYIWPHHWNLPSFDPDCLSSVFFLQLNFAGQYDLVECTDPDLSPSGTLPFLVHNSKQIATSRSILSYLSTLKDERENGAIEEDKIKAQRTAWNAYANRQLRDIVVCELLPQSHTRTELSDDYAQNHVLYANAENYRAGVHSALVAILPLPSRYYVPARLREEVRANLEPVGLWKLDEEDEKPKKGPFEKPATMVEEKDYIIREAFVKEKVSQLYFIDLAVLTVAITAPGESPQHIRSLESITRTSLFLLGQSVCHSYISA